MAKVRGPGGIGQWDTGTAQQDIRAATPRSSNGGGWSPGGGIVGGGPAGMMQHLYDTGKVKRPSPRRKPRSKGRK